MKNIVFIPYIKREELPEWGLEDVVLFEVDVEGMSLAADLQSLIDKGAMIDPDSEKLWWEEDEEPENLKRFLVDGAIEIFDLLNDPEIIYAAVRTTKTAAIREDISSERIKRGNY